jgi:hypothetical protein
MQVALRAGKKTGSVHINKILERLGHDVDYLHEPARPGERAIILWREPANVLQSVFSAVHLNKRRQRGLIADSGIDTNVWYWWLDPTRQYDWLAIHHVTWLTRFYTQCLNNASPDSLYVKYETFYADEVKGTKRILKWMGARVPWGKAIRQATDPKDYTFNDIPYEDRVPVPESSKAILRHIPSYVYEQLEERSNG